jgi:hypothetical protein
MNIVKVPLLKPADEPILAGRLAGRRAFVTALEAVPPLTEPTLVILDFSRADYATSSFLAELVVPLRDHLQRQPAYVVVANLADMVREELEEFLRRSGEAILACKLSSESKVSSVELLGRLDDKLQETFRLVQRRGEASAAELHAESSDAQSIGPTAWNNRLTALAAKNLLIETPQGRAKKYRLVLEIA